MASHTEETLTQQEVFQALRVVFFSVTFILTSFASLFQLYNLLRNNRVRCLFLFLYPSMNIAVIMLFISLVFIPSFTIIAEMYVFERVVALRYILPFTHTSAACAYVWTIVAMVRKRTRAQQHCSRKKYNNRAKRELIYVWVGSLLLALPRLFISRQLFWFDDSVPQTDGNLAKIYFTVLFMVLYVIPMVSTAYFAFAREPYQKSALALHRLKLYRNISNYSVVLFSLFLLVNLPMISLELGYVYGAMRMTRTLETTYELLLGVSWLAYTLNPIVYAKIFKKRRVMRFPENSQTNSKPLAELGLVFSNSNHENNDVLAFMKDYCEKYLINIDWNRAYGTTDTPNASPQRVFGRAQVGGKRRGAITEVNKETQVNIIEKLRQYNKR